MKLLLDEKELSILAQIDAVKSTLPKLYTDYLKLSILPEENEFYVKLIYQQFPNLNSETSFDLGLISATLINIYKSQLETIQTIIKDHNTTLDEFIFYIRNFASLHDDEFYEKYKEPFMEYNEVFKSSVYTTSSQF